MLVIAAAAAAALVVVVAVAVAANVSATVAPEAVRSGPEAVPQPQGGWGSG